jgi:hypothetical protein
MEGPRDPKVYREPDLEANPPRLHDVVGVFAGCKVETKRDEDGELLLIVSRGGERHLIKA